MRSGPEASTRSAALALLACVVALAACDDPTIATTPPLQPPPTTTVLQVTVRHSVSPIRGSRGHWALEAHFDPGLEEDGTPRPAGRVLMVNGDPLLPLATPVPRIQTYRTNLVIPVDSVHLVPIVIEPPEVEGIRVHGVTVLGLGQPSRDSVFLEEGDDLELVLGLPELPLQPLPRRSSWSATVATVDSEVLVARGEREPPPTLVLPRELLPADFRTVEVTVAYGRRWSGGARPGERGFHASYLVEGTFSWDVVLPRGQ